eukprot:1014040-Pyramimonas_sp.AAC.1
MNEAHQKTLEKNLGDREGELNMLDAASALAMAKSIAREIAPAVRRQLSEQIVAQKAARHHWHAVALRGIRAQQDHLLCRALSSHPVLQQFFDVDSVQWNDVDGLCSHTQDMHVAMLNEEEEEVSNDKNIQ